MLELQSALLDLEEDLERIRGKQGEKLQKTRRLACNPIPSIVK